MPVPVTVLTGFLGAGKTTLLNRLLRGDHGRRIGVIVNEFGEAGVDGELLASGPEELVELANGCVCCTVRGDLLRTLHRLSGAALDALVIETTGLADPGPVAQTFLFDDTLREDWALDGIVTVADAIHIRDQLTAQPEAAEQLALADLVLVTKTDLAAPAELAAIRAAVRRASPGARVVDAAGLVPQDLLDLGGYDLARLGDDLRLPREPIHGSSIGSATLTASSPLDEDRTMSWLSAHLAENGQDVLRTKGILDVAGEDRKLVLQGVHMVLEGDFLGHWPAGPRQSRLVLIGRGLDRPALQASFHDCIA